MKIKDILQSKGSEVWTVRAEQSIQDAVRLLVWRNVGALLVVDGRKKIVGIISERDIVRNAAEGFQSLENARVSDLMSSDLAFAAPNDEIEAVMETMTERRVRHVPVKANGKLVGLVSIGDVVKSLIQDSQHQIRYLKEFMYGSNSA